MNVSVDSTPSIGPDPADDVEELVVVLAHRLGEHVEGAGGDDDVVDLVEVGQRVGDHAGVPPRPHADHGLPGEADLQGSVTATICMIPASSNRCTRWRTAASDSPTAAAIRA